MANEITVSLNLGVTQNGNSANGAANFKADALAGGFIGSEQDIPTSATEIDFAGIGTPQFLFIENLDPTNYIQVDANSSFDGFPQKIFPGEAILLSPQTASIYAKADTASVKIWICAC